MHNRIADDISLSLRLSLSFEAYKYENALHEPPNQNEMEIIVRMHKSIVCCPHMRNSTDFSFVCVFGVSRYGTWMMMSRCVFFLGFFFVIRVFLVISVFCVSWRVSMPKANLYSSTIHAMHMLALCVCELGPRRAWSSWSVCLCMCRVVSCLCEQISYTAIF